MGAILLYVLPYLAVLTLVITVHELGHFLVARSLGMGVERFSIGFGRALASWRDRAGVEWRIGWIPLGGYVKFAGVETAATVPDRSDLAALRREVEAREGRAAVGRYYDFRPVWQRAAVAVAGPAANFLMSIVIFAGMLWAFGASVNLPRVGGVMAGSPAARAGVMPGDLVLALDGRPMADFPSMIDYVRFRGGRPVSLTVERRTPAGPNRLQLVVTPEPRLVAEPLTGRRFKTAVLGVFNSRDPADFKRVRYSPPQAVALGVQRVGDIVGGTAVYLGRVVRGLESGDQLSGPFGMARVSGELTRAEIKSQPTVGAKVGGGALLLLQIAAVLSVGIGFMNLLPIPVLDGGHLLFYAYEAVARRPLSHAVQAAGLRVGLVLLLGLMLFATWNDLQQSDLLRMLGRLFS